MSVLLTVGPKCTLAASHADPWSVTVSKPTGQTDKTDGQTDGCQTVTLRFPLDAVSILIISSEAWRLKQPYRALLTVVVRSTTACVPAACT